MVPACKVEYSKGARRRLRRLPNSVAQTIVGKIDSLVVDPFGPICGELTVAAILSRGEAYR